MKTFENDGDMIDYLHEVTGIPIKEIVEVMESRRDDGYFILSKYGNNTNKEKCDKLGK